jgi:hypothetical protein
MANKKKERIMSPRGVAHYPWVKTPDTKFKPKGEYKCGIVLNKADSDTQALITKLEGERDAIVEAIKGGTFMWMGDTVKLKPYQIQQLNVHPVYKDILDDETGQPTGDIIVTAKQNAVYGKNDEYKANITVVNSKGTPDANLNVFGGDTIKMLFTVSGFWNAKDQLAGLTVRLVAVQVIESNGGSGGDYGFGDEGDGAIGVASSDDDSGPDFYAEDAEDTPDADF